MSVMQANHSDRGPLQDTLCAADGCYSRSVAGAPVNVCGQHLREMYEFAQQIVNERWADQLEAARPVPVAPPARPKKDIPSWVYFVRIGKLIKIGYSTYPKARFKGLKVDEVLAVIPGTLEDERRCHAAFEHLREHGEYFRPGVDLLAFIADAA